MALNISKVLEGKKHIPLSEATDIKRARPLERRLETNCFLLYLAIIVNGFINRAVLSAVLFPK